MKTHERCYRFPTNLQLERFMNSMEHYTGYELSGFYSGTSKHGDLTVTQALPYLRARVPWKIEGNTVTFDFMYVVLHFEPSKVERVDEHMFKQANLFGAGLTRYSG